MSDLPVRNLLLDNVRRQLEAARSRDTGTTVIFRGDRLVARKEEVSGAKAGEQGVPKAVLQQYVADTDPSLFVFNPSDFTPYTDRALPEVGEFIGFMGWSYQITHKGLDAAADSAFGIYAYALRHIYPG